MLAQLQGILLVSQHEADIDRALEKKGIVADCCEIKREIKADNALRWALQAQAAEFDVNELTNARLELRPGMDRSTASRIQTAYDTQYGPFTMAEAKRDASKILGEDDEPRCVRERFRNHQQEKNVPRKKDRER